MNINKSSIIENLADQAKIPKKKAEDIVDLIFDSMAGALSKGGRIEIRGFGSFVCREYQAYKGRNPRTGSAIEVAPKKLPFFKVGKDLKRRVDSGTNPAVTLQHEPENTI